MMGVQNRGKSQVAILVLTILTVVIAVLSILLSITIYGIASENINDNRVDRTGVNYIKTKLRCNDYKDGIQIGKFNGTDAIYLYQDIDDATYTTIIYVHSGYLKELFCDAGYEDEFELSSGDDVLEAQGLEISRQGNIIEVNFTNTDGRTQSFEYLIRSGSYTIERDE